MTDFESVSVLFLWFAGLGVLLFQAWSRKRGSLGLSVAYWFQLWLIHWLGGFIHVLSLQTGEHHQDTLVGFQVTGYAIGGLVCGTIVARLLMRGPVARPWEQGLGDDQTGLFRKYIVIGGLLCFVFDRVAMYIPSCSALAGSGLGVLTAGFSFLWFWRWREGRPGGHWRVLGSIVLVPFLTVLVHGLMGIGVAVILNMGAFVAVYFKPRWLVVVLGVAALLAGITIFPGYMAAREEMRKSIWHGGSLGERLEKMSLIVTGWQGFDLENKQHLELIDSRLNQNFLVGAASRYMERQNIPFAGGETLANALLALIPRVVWPDKPQWAGSGDLVTRYTGIKFASGTSVGIGHLMELYINFGRPGVFLGCFLLGIMFATLDVKGATWLARGEWKKVTLAYVVGLSFMGATGNFAEATAAAAGGTVLILTINEMSARQERKRAARLGTLMATTRAPFSPS
jgi:hypothetical protein